MTYELIEQMKQEAIERLNYIVVELNVDPIFLCKFKTNGRPATGYLGRVIDTTEQDMWNVRKAEICNDFLVYAVIPRTSCFVRDLYFLTVSPDKNRWPSERAHLKGAGGVRLYSCNKRKILSYNYDINDILENKLNSWKENNWKC